MYKHHHFGMIWHIFSGDFSKSNKHVLTCQKCQAEAAKVQEALALAKSKVGEALAPNLTSVASAGLQSLPVAGRKPTGGGTAVFGQGPSGSSVTQLATLSFLLRCSRLPCGQRRICWKSWKNWKKPFGQMQLCAFLME